MARAPASASPASCGRGRARTPAGEYLAGYAIERSLSLDNVFVFVVALSAFAVPAEVRPWAVAWAIGAALALRAVFILAGSALLGAAEWTAYVFAAFLIVDRASSS